MSYRILIADDNKDFTDLFRDYVSLYEDIELVGVAENGMTTYELLLQNRPDVLLLDLVMPDMDGIELLRRIRGMDGVKPAIFVISALSNDAITHEALTLGACAYFTKPIDIESVIARIRSLS